MNRASDLSLPATCLPAWGVADLPVPEPLSWKRWYRFLGPGIVMMGIQIGGGEWLVGPDITARFGGGLMWLATVAIVVQVFYNLECGRYALYCGEPIFTGFMRTRPGPKFWIALLVMLSLGAILPGLALQAGAIVAAIRLGRPPDAADRQLVMTMAYLVLVASVLPVLFGGKIYNTLQLVMTAKVFVVLGFTLAVGLTLVRPESWADIASGFVRFGSVPVQDPEGNERLVNAFGHYWSTGAWPVLSLASMATIGSFAGYAGGGGLGNSLYSNYVRDKGWGMGGLVGAIPSAVGGTHVSLSHLGKVFRITPENLKRFGGWWRYVVVDQLAVWAPGCFMGMALPALLSLEFAPHSPVYTHREGMRWAQAVLSADGLRLHPSLGESLSGLLWLATLFVGLMVLVPSQMSIVEDVSRRWTDVIWSANGMVRERLRGHQVKYIYYSILSVYVGWCCVSLYLFALHGTPALMTEVIANLNNLALGFTSFHLLWVNHALLPRPLRPRWYHTTGLACCGLFYLGMFVLVFCSKVWPLLRPWWHRILGSE